MTTAQKHLYQTPEVGWPTGQHVTPPTAHAVAMRIAHGNLVPRYAGDFYLPGMHLPKPRRPHDGHCRSEINACEGCKAPHPACACCGAPTAYAWSFEVMPKWRGHETPPRTHYMTFCEDCWAVVQSVRTPDADRTGDIEL